MIYMQPLVPQIFLVACLTLTCNLQAGIFGSWGQEDKAKVTPAPAQLQPAFPPLSQLVPTTPEEFSGEVQTDPELLEYFKSNFLFLGEGDASNYGRKDGFQGKKASNGEIFDLNAVTAAIVGFWSGEGEDHCFTRLPRSDHKGVGYPLLVVYQNPESPETPPRWLFVRITDRGPYANGPWRKRWRKKKNGRRTRIFKDAIKPYVRFTNATKNYWSKKNWAWRWRNCNGSPAWKTRMPYPGRIMDLSEKVFKTLGGEEAIRHGLLKGIQVYLPPLDLLPEDLPKLMRQAIPYAP
jgi:hypothetical protein